MSGTHAQILGQLAKNRQGMTSKQLSKVVGVAAFTVTYYCEKWVKSGMVCWRWDGEKPVKIWFLCAAKNSQPGIT